MPTYDTARANLHTRLATLVKRSAGLDTHLRGEDGRNDADFADRVAFVENDEVIDALDVETRAEVLAIQRALSRMDAGTWEACASCGEPIGERRLAALPTTSTCVGCAS